MGEVLRARTSMGNGWVSGRKGGRGRELTAGNSAPQHLSTASWDDENDGNVIPHVSVVGSDVGADPTSPAVKFRKVGAGTSWTRQSSTTMLQLGLLSS